MHRCWRVCVPLIWQSEFTCSRSREVVSDGDVIFGRVVPPRNPVALARAQLEVFAMLGHDEELEMFEPLAVKGPSLKERMNQMKELRRELGLRFRQYIQDNFGIEWYIFDNAS